MKIDLLCELQHPDIAGGRDEARLFWETMAQIEAADEAGFNTLWMVEHHFLTGFSHSSAPEVFLAAAAQHTRRIRIGHGVVLLPHPFNHPIRVAERIATLDILSKGRVEFGTGRSSQYEQEAFGIDPAESRAMWQEALQIIPRMWTQETFSYKGRYYDIPERQIIPKPVQKPHPRIWMACTSPESWEIAGRNGIGPLGLTLMLGVDEFRAYVDSYRRALRHARPAGAFINDEVGVFTIAHCGERGGEAETRGAEAAAWYIRQAVLRFGGVVQPVARTGNEQGNGNGHGVPSSPLLGKGVPREGSGEGPGVRSSAKGSWQDIRERRLDILGRVSGGEAGPRQVAAEDMIIVGDPDACIAKLKRYEAAGAGRVLCLMQAGRLPHEAVMESIRLFGRHVIPLFSPSP